MSIDSFHQIAIQPLRDGTDLRENVQASLASFKVSLNCNLSVGPFEIS